MDLTKSRNQRGFTLIEIMVAVTLSLLLLGIVVGVFTSQREVFTLQNELNNLQANGRAAADFITRAVQNSGYNVSRGSRFLAASDRYLTSVFDEDNDGIIQNDEVITFALSNASGAATETFTISPYFDMDGSDTIDGTETRDYDIALTLDCPSYNLYKILPSVSDATYSRYKLAQFIDNLVIRYFDKNDNPLPAGVAEDADGNPVPPYVIPAGELNDIRRVEVVVVARTRNRDPRANYQNSGSYASGSVASLCGAGTYSDSYHRQTFTASTSPRNLITAPWGKMDVSVNPNPVVCPQASTTVTATLIDSDGDSASSGVTVNFNASAGTLGASSSSTNNYGEATTTLTYDWESPNKTVTLSANSLISVAGTDYPVFNAIPVTFQSGSGILSDNFDDGNSNGWVEEGAANWNVASQQYKTASNGYGASLNGCAAWQDYEMQIDIKRNGSLGTGEYAGMILRYGSSNLYYLVRIYCFSCTGSPVSHVYKLQIIYWNGGADVLTEQTVAMDDNIYYTFKASIVGDALSAKIWETAGTEPPGWDITATDTRLISGKIGLTATKSAVTFDNVIVNPPV